MIIPQIYEKIKLFRHFPIFYFAFIGFFVNIIYISNICNTIVTFLQICAILCPDVWQTQHFAFDLQAQAGIRSIVIPLLLLKFDLKFCATFFSD